MRRVPLTYAQEGLWFVEQLNETSRAYHMTFAVRLKGIVDLSALRRALAEVVRRQEALRTHFEVVQGEAVQVITEPAEVAVNMYELSGDEKERELAAYISAESERPFELDQGPLVRLSVVTVGAEEHVVVVVMHHLISDGGSINIMTREVVALYEAYVAGAESPLNELPIQYGDYAVWQRQSLQEEVVQQALVYWRQQLSGIQKVLRLPVNGGHAANEPEAGVESLRVSEELSQRLGRAQQQHGVTLFMLVLTGLVLVLHHQTEAEDVVVGTDAANRNRVELEGVMGLFVNMLALRVQVSGAMSLGDLLRQVREVTLGAYARQEVPFERVVEAVGGARSESGKPLFEIVCVVEHEQVGDVTLAGGVQLEPVNVGSGEAKFELVVNVTERGGVVGGYLQYAQGVYGSVEMKRLAAELALVLQQLTENPEQQVSEVRDLLRQEQLAQRRAQELQYQDQLHAKLRSIRSRPNLRKELGQGA